MLNVFQEVWHFIWHFMTVEAYRGLTLALSSIFLSFSYKRLENTLQIYPDMYSCSCFRTVAGTCLHVWTICCV